MKLVFPGGEHPQVLLGMGVNRIGSDPHANIVLDRPGVLPQHCQLHVTASGVMLDVPHGTTVSVNGRQVDGLIALRPGMHKYMFVVNGERWVTDPEAERYVDDGFGMRNAVIAITPPGRSI